MKTTPKSNMTFLQNPFSQTKTQNLEHPQKLKNKNKERILQRHIEASTTILQQQKF